MSKANIISLVTIATLTLCQGAISIPAEKPLGLQQQGTRILKDGKPWRGIGVNYVDAFINSLTNPDTPQTEEVFKYLSEHAIPFVRTPAEAWGGGNMELYQKDKAEYFRRMDITVRLAEKYNVGLICSMFWSGWVKDLTGESDLAAWSTPGTKTHQLMAAYVEDVVTRYRSSPAIWGWEWGNELGLSGHLPNAADFNIRPEDNHTFETMRRVHASFAREVRKHDPSRIISSGDGLPRETAWHNWKESSWTKDTPKQFAEVLSKNAPDPLSVLSIHTYGDDFKPHRFNVATDVVRKMNRPLFVGEFGVSGPRTEASEKEFREQLAILQQQNVVLSALWEFDVKPTPRPEWLISPTNDKTYMIEAIGAINRKWAKEQK